MMPATLPHPASTTASTCPVCSSENWRKRFHKQSFDFVQCPKCQLMRLDPLPTEQQLREHYEKRAAQGNYELSKASERTPTLEGVFAYLRAHRPQAGKIFDVGCFDGGLLDIAAAAGWETWGLEIQGQAADAAKEKHPQRIYEGTLEGFDSYQHESFDVCTAISVIEHLMEPQRLMEFASRALKPGGLLLIQAPNLGSMPAKVLGPYWPCVAAPEHTFYFNAHNIERLGSRFGFAMLDWKPHWKPLRFGYALGQFQNFGPEIYRLTGWLEKALPAAALNARLPLYGGEMLTLLEKRST